jgi:serine/threonine protein kinase
VKSASILLSVSGAAVLADFGLAQLVKTIYPCTFAFNNSVVGGTSQRALNWTAPENFDGSSDGHGKPASDVNSFGMVLYEMAAGKVPWSEEKESSTIAVAVASGRRPVIPQTCAPWLAELMQQCWRQNFTDRPTMATVLHILQPHFLKLSQTLDTLDVDKVATQGSAPNFDTVADAVKTMAALLADEQFQAAGCTFLADFYRKPNHQTTDKLTTLQEIKAIVAALHAHRSSVNVQHQGCRALLNITCSNKNKVGVS